MVEKKVNYRCPFCDSHISKEKYEKVVKENEFLKKKLKQLEKEKEEFKKKEKKLKEKLDLAVKEARLIERKRLEKEISSYKLKEKEYKEKEKKLKKEKDEAVKQARIAERKKHGSKLEQYEKMISKQREEIERLKKGKTVQEEGFDFENDMQGLLKEVFFNDEVKKTGKKGDSLIKIKNRNKVIGTILIECKKVQKHSPSHIDEVKRHKITAKAEAGVLVTNGEFNKNVKMDGFKNIDGVLVIRPNSAIDFIKLLRKHLLEIDNLKKTEEEKNREMEKLWHFIHSQEFESQMDSILRQVNQLQNLDTKEKKLLDERGLIENKIIQAHDLILKGIKETKKK